MADQRNWKVGATLASVNKTTPSLKTCGLVVTSFSSEEYNGKCVLKHM